jgi:exosortase
MNTRRGPWRRASLAVLLVLLYLPLFAELVDRSASNPYAGHVVFVPIFAAVVIWLERHRFRRAAEHGRAPGLSVAAVAVVTGWIAYGIGNFPLYVVSFVAAATGLLLSFFGRSAVRAAVFPLALLLLMVPPPQAAMTAAALEMQYFVAAFSAFVLGGIGVPVALDGIALRLPELTVIVAEECSGLRFLLIQSVFAAVLARTVLAGASPRVMLVMLSVPIAVLANAMRVTVTSLGAYAVGPEIATGPLHYYIGKGFWTAALVATIGLALWLRTRATVRARGRLEAQVGECVRSVS